LNHGQRIRQYGIKNEVLLGVSSGTHWEIDGNVFGPHREQKKETKKIPLFPPKNSKEIILKHL
jgi:hypothetical protein